MTDEISEQGGSERDVSTADEQALTDLFASLVADAPPSEVSPLEIVKLGRIGQKDALDSRTKRFRVVRNVAVAAVLAVLVVLIVPHLGSNSSESTAAASSSSSAAAAGGAPLPQAGVAAGGSAAAGSAAPGGAAGSTAGSAAGSAPASAGSTSAAAASGAMSSAAMSAGAAVPEAAATDRGGASRSSARTTPAAAPDSGPTSSGAASSVAGSSTGCPSLPAEALTAFRSAFPAGYYGPALAGSRAAPCSLFLFESVVPVVKGGAVLSVTVRRAAVGACRAVCRPEPGQSGVYFGDTSGGGPGNLVVAPVYVYADGYEVSVFIRGTGPPPIAPSFERLVAGARAAIKTLG